MSISRADFGAANGSAVDLYTLTNAQGVTAKIATYGGTWVSLLAPDRQGQPGDVLLGFDSLAGYLGDHPYFGSLVGRVGNRIARGHFELGGVAYELACNNGPNHLHGGPGGFHRAVWRAEVRADGDEPSLALSYLSRDGEEGYPGNLAVTVVYTLTAKNELRLDYSASTDRDTIVNLTNHAYFNLSGGGDVLGHQIQIDAARFVPVGPDLIPTGELRAVAGTPMDFRAGQPIGARLPSDDEQIASALGGYDHCWALDHPAGQLGRAARVTEPGSGRVMEVFTTQPGVQFYTGNFLDGTLAGKRGQRYEKYAGLCLETQHFPDAPNQPQFPSIVLRPGETYQQTTVYQFLVG